MGDANRAASLRKNLQKHAGRAKELIRQNLGKSDKTTDENFEEYVKNFGLQQLAAARLVKEVRNYNSCLKALQVASKTMMDLICELYEPNWVEHDKVQVKADLLEKKWEDLHSTIEDQVVKSLTSYSEQFSEVSSKISKRKRKLIDYDSSRHAVENLEQHRNKEKKKDETKLLKAKEQMEDKQQLYETINAELMIELPALWDSRISFLASNFQCLFVAESTFHGTSQRIYCDLNDVVELLALEHQRGRYSVKRYSFITDRSEDKISVTPPKEEGDGEEEEQQKQQQQDEDVGVVESNESFVTARGMSSDEACLTETSVLSEQNNSTTDLGEMFAVQYESPVITKISEDNETLDIDKIKLEEKEAKGDKPNETGTKLPPGVLQKLKATYQYTAEDSDELSFEPGEIIYVTEFDDSEQQEEGWLMGYKEGTDVKGLFPANFTKPV